MCADETELQVNTGDDGSGGRGVPVSEHTRKSKLDTAQSHFLLWK